MKSLGSLRNTQLSIYLIIYPFFSFFFFFHTSILALPSSRNSHEEDSFQVLETIVLITPKEA